MRPYVSTEQLAAATPWSVDAVEKMVRRGVLKRGVHYFQPFGHRTQLLFKWEAIEALIENRKSVVATQNEPATGVQVLDVEKAQAGLQRLLG